MSRIDAITAVMAIPVVEENGEERDARPGEAVLDDYVKGLEDRFADFNRRAGGPSGLDTVWTDLLGQPAIVNDADFGIYEKKGLVYPAILMNPAGITAGDGTPLADLITERFREDHTRGRLAELIGKRLGVDWVSIFVTFGSTA